MNKILIKSTINKGENSNKLLLRLILTSYPLFTLTYVIIPFAKK